MYDVLTPGFLDALAENYREPDAEDLDLAEDYADSPGLDHLEPMSQPSPTPVGAPTFHVDPLLRPLAGYRTPLSGLNVQ